MANIVTRFWVSLAMGVLVWVPVLALAATIPEYTITIKDHRFDPAEAKIPADTKVKLIIDNQDATAEEFESFEFNREKIVAGHKKIVMFIGPLQTGSYRFFGEFHKDTAQGMIIVK